MAAWWFFGGLYIARNQLYLVDFPLWNNTVLRTSCRLSHLEWTIFWLVVWNMKFIFPYIGNNHPNWLSYFSGVETTNQFLCSLRFWSDKPCFNFCPWAWTPMVATVVGLESSRIIYSNGFCVKSFRQSLLTTKRGKWIHHLLKSSKRSCHTKTGIDQHQIKKN